MTTHSAYPCRGIGRCCGSFGELLQGMLPGDGAFLVTLPIRRYSLATFHVDAPDGPLQVVPAHKWKALLLVRSLLARRGLPATGTLNLSSDLPEGKGLASSTADLVAAYRAIVACHALWSSTTELHELLRAIEPSDGVMHEGIVAFRHCDVQLYERLGAVPPLTLVAIDEGGQVNTLAMRQHAHDAELQLHYLDLLQRLQRALHLGDLSAVGQISTRSAELNQRHLPKHHFAAVREIAKIVNAIGIVATHSGTCLAVMLDGCDPHHDAQRREAVDLLSTLSGAGHDVAVYESAATPRELRSALAESSVQA